MRFNGQITVTLLTAALASAACSDSGQTSQAQPERPARTAPVSMTRVSASAGDTLTKASAPEPVGPVSFDAAAAAYEARDYPQAMTLFEQYTRESPENAWGHFMLGLSAWKGGDSGKAEAAFGAALAIDPNHVRSLVNLSRVLIEQGRPDEAIEKLVRAADIEPDAADVHRVLGRTYAAQGQTDKAADAYRRAIAMDERDAWAMNNLGLLFFEQERPEDAVPLLARAVELGQDEPVFHNNLGMALEHTERFNAAAAEYSSALASDPNYEKAQWNLARVEVLRTDSEEPLEPDTTARRFVELTELRVEEPAAFAEESGVSPGEGQDPVEEAQATGEKPQGPVDETAVAP